eukprot:GCRY01000374.1.p1 GENE.GCRY01000374.1~~GCRY01000374.1.p1  ORF type:complete len:314 (+),score=89.53 GCRY01000374.1:176-1117(+)
MGCGSSKKAQEQEVVETLTILSGGTLLEENSELPKEVVISFPITEQKLQEIFKIEDFFLTDSDDLVVHLDTLLPNCTYTIEMATPKKVGFGGEEAVPIEQPASPSLSDLEREKEDEEDRRFDELRAAFASKEPPKPPAPTRAESPDENHLRILVADDNIVALRVAKQLLRKMGYVTETVVNGREAAELYLSSPNAVDCILMDVDMPEMDGIAATRYIRESEDAHVHVPIFAVTGFLKEGLEEECMNAGMDGYVDKPVTNDKLLPKLREVAEGLVGARSNAGVSHTLLLQKLNNLFVLQQLDDVAEEEPEQDGE